MHTILERHARSAYQRWWNWAVSRPGVIILDFGCTAAMEFGGVIWLPPEFGRKAREGVFGPYVSQT